MSPSFAEAELQKYGWKSGDGLGKERSGIKKAIRVNVKNDTNGLGKDNDRYEFQWWDHIYNKSTSNIVIHKDDGGVKLHSSNKSTSMITTTAPSLSSQTDNNSPLYSLFVKSTVEEKDYTLKISDEELFKICEGRTARKGARYDQGGKLERVDEKCVQNVDVENIQKEGSENLEGKVMNASGGDFAPLEKDCVGKKKGSSKKRKAVGEEEKRDKTKRVKKSKFDEKEATKEKQRRKKSKSKGAFDVPSVADGQIEEPEAPEKKKRKGETSDDKASRKKKKKEKRKEK